MTDVPELVPFRGIRYPSSLDPALVTSPPYDVISPEQQQLLLDHHPRNFVRLILPLGGEDKYNQAAETLAQWLTSATLVPDPEPSYYLYAMDYEFAGERRTTAGIMGALGLDKFGEGKIFPHEITMPGPKADRLALMRATRANLEPLWLVAADSLPGLHPIADSYVRTTPLADVTDSSEVRHRIWSVPPSEADDVVEQLQGVPLVIADGHHRYETAITYQDERRSHDGAGPWDSVLAMVVDPKSSGPTLLPIHRVARHIDVPRMVSELGADPFDGDLSTLADAVSTAGVGTIGLAGALGRWTVRSDGSLDSEFLGDLLGPQRDVSYEHDLRAVADAVASGAAGFLLAAVPLSMVIERALSGQRMPPKTTLFWPKPLSGLVFRSLEP